MMESGFFICHPGRDFSWYSGVSLGGAMPSRALLDLSSLSAVAVRVGTGRFESREFRSCKVWKGSAENWFFLKADLSSWDHKDFKNINVTFIVNILSGRIQEVTVCMMHCQKIFIFSLFIMIWIRLQSYCIVLIYDNWGRSYHNISSRTMVIVT